MLFVAFHMCLAHVDGWFAPPIASLLWCFTGYHLDDFGLSGVSLATISLTRSAPMQRGARPARSFTHFSNSFLLFLAPPASCRFFEGVGRSGVSLATIWMTLGPLVFHWLLFR